MELFESTHCSTFLFYQAWPRKPVFCQGWVSDVSFELYHRSQRGGQDQNDKYTSRLLGTPAKRTSWQHARHSRAKSAVLIRRSRPRHFKGALVSQWGAAQRKDDRHYLISWPKKLIFLAQSPAQSCALTRIMYFSVSTWKSGQLPSNFWNPVSRPGLCSVLIGSLGSHPDLNSWFMLITDWKFSLCRRSPSYSILT